MKILVISNTIPKYPGGGGDTRIIKLLHYLSLSAEVHFLPIPHAGYSFEEVEAFNIVCPHVHFVQHPLAKIEQPGNVANLRSGAILRHVKHVFTDDLPYRAVWNPHIHRRVHTIVRDVLAADKYDVVQIEHSELAPWRQVIPDGIYTALDFQDVVTSQLNTYIAHSSIRRRVEYYVEKRKFARFERHWSKEFDLCLVTSKEEQYELKRLQANCHTLIVPNGVDTQFFTPSSKEPEPYRLVFTGSMTHYPNIDAMLFFCNRILPQVQAKLPQVTLDIVGQNPQPQIEELAKTHPGVRVTGKVDDIRPFIWNAAVYVAPVRIGGGTRLKILEALACGKAVVATPFASKGAVIQNDEHALLREDPSLFAEAIINLLCDNTKRLPLQEAGRRLVVERYDWAKISARLLEAYAKGWTGVEGQQED